MISHSLSYYILAAHISILSKMRSSSQEQIALASNPIGIQKDTESIYKDTLIRNFAKIIWYLGRDIRGTLFD